MELVCGMPNRKSARSYPVAAAGIGWRSRSEKTGENRRDQLAAVSKFDTRFESENPKTEVVSVVVRWKLRLPNTCVRPLTACVRRDCTLSWRVATSVGT